MPLQASGCVLRGCGSFHRSRGRAPHRETQSEGVGTMPPDYRKYKVLDEYLISTEKELSMGIYKAVQMVKPNDGPVEIRICYYTRRRRNDGSEWWGLAPRPPHFLPEEAKKVAEGISELADKYFIIKQSIGV